MTSPHIGLAIADLAENSFRGRKIDKSETDSRRNATGFSDCTNDVLVLYIGRYCSRWTTNSGSQMAPTTREGSRCGSLIIREGIFGMSGPSSLAPSSHHAFRWLRTGKKGLRIGKRSGSLDNRVGFQPHAYVRKIRCALASLGNFEGRFHRNRTAICSYDADSSDGHFSIWPQYFHHLASDRGWRRPRRRGLKPKRMRYRTGLEASEYNLWIRARGMALDLRLLCPLRMPP